MSATAPAEPAPGDGGAWRQPVYRNPFRLAVSASPWRSAWYLACYLIVGSALTAAVLVTASIAAACAVTIAGLPLLIAASNVIRSCANTERRRLRAVFTAPVRVPYHELAQPGMLAQVSTRWRHDPATWRDIAYLLGLWLPLTILDTVVLAVWGWLLSWITLPLWYWAPWVQYHGSRIRGYELGFYFPHGPYGPGAVGVFVGSLPVALLAAAAGLAGFLMLNYALVAAARAHALAARALLRPPADPLAPAREVLASPGPLSILIPNER
ncbi:MAG: sensor domain-containing protein [Streptosporangiaceae bacterium]|nr:sensor domain-containing protein [Streptosporangiaceae bacterium]MBV9852941.1 sensor domain-containing protein [Streptosporangiaceae bacterium]